MQDDALRPVAAPHRDTRTGQPFAIEESLGYLANRLARSFAQALSARLDPHGVTLAQWAVLVILWDQDGLTQRVLSRRVAIDETTMTRTLGRMERDGLVHRRRSRRDRRQVHVHLTERGRELRDPLIPLAGQVNAIATTGLTDAEHEQARDLLRRMLVSLDMPPPTSEQEPS